MNGVNRKNGLNVCYQAKEQLQLIKSVIMVTWCIRPDARLKLCSFVSFHQIFYSIFKEC